MIVDVDLEMVVDVLFGDVKFHFRGEKVQVRGK